MQQSENESLVDVVHMQKRIEARIKQFANDFMGSDEGDLPIESRFLSIIQKQLNTLGKKVRPTLLIMTFHHYAMQQNYSEKEYDELLNYAIDCAAALETLHTFFLIHDDIIDRSPLRRGVPTIHKQLQDDAYTDSEHAGVSLAIVAGDLVFLHVYDLLFERSPNPEIFKKVFAIMQQIVHNTVIGEVIDIDQGSRTIGEVTLEQIERGTVFKTAYYTMYAPMFIGAIIGHENTADQLPLLTIGESIGYAFQLQDDILGLFSTEKELGKPILSDLKEGKKTVLVKTTYDSASDEDKAFIDGILGNQDVTEQDLVSFREIVEKTKAKEKIDTLISKLFTKGYGTVDQLAISDAGKKQITEFLTAIRDRKK